MRAREKSAVHEWTHVTIDANLDAIAPAVDAFRQQLAVRGAAPALIDGLRLALSEALTNAVKHGLAASGAHAVALQWSWADEWLVVEVSEPGRFAPGPAWTELPSDPLAESGRGGFLIAQHFDEVAHENRDGRHTLRLARRIGAPPFPPATAAELEQTLSAMTEELSANYETLSALFKLAEALATTKDLPAFAEHALQLRTLVEADTMYVRLRDSSGALTLLASAAEGIALSPTVAAASEAIEADVFRTGRERTIDGTTRLGDDDPLRALGGGAFVCPVHFQSRQLGVCVIARRTYDAFFTAGQIALARTTAEFLGIACANAELQAQRLAQLRVERELEIAAQIQQSLVPKEFPVRHDWRIHGLCVNAQEAGGDFFDVLEVPGGVLLVIADVMGKGVSAALLAVVLRTAVRAHAPLAANPGELLNQISVQLAPDLDRLGIFITAQAAFLSADAPTVTYGNAGHCPIVVLTREGGSRVFTEGGLPLGVSQRERYDRHEETLASGDRLLLLTDGILEAPDAEGRELGLDGLLAATAPLADVGVPAFCVELLAHVRRRDAGRAPSDDRTLLAVQCLS
jgi:serine phosphatase RsbU (regulator of sigma subunit)/anti-sigma regulatory factor (Ser/Thr protein kinase)